MGVSKSKVKKVTYTCSMSYDEFVAYYNNCICMGSINENDTVEIEGLNYKIKDNKIFLCGSNADELAQYATSKEIEEDIVVKIKLPDYVNAISSWAFCANIFLTEISGQGIEYIGTNCMLGCYRLSKVDFPNLKDIGCGAFKECYALKEINLLKCEKIKTYAFKGCHLLQEIKAPVLTECGLEIFSQCYSLNSCYMDSLEYIHPRTFEECHALRTLYAPKIIFGVENMLDMINQKTTPYSLLNDTYCISKLNVGVFVGTFDYFHKSYVNCDLTYSTHITKKETDK